MAAMPLLCIIQGTVCLWLQGENLPTSPRINQHCQLHLPLSLSALGFNAGCVYLGPLGCLQTLWSGNIPGLCQPSLACRARRALTGTKQRRGWVEGLVYHSIKSCRANWGNEHVPFSLAKYLVSDFCWNTFLFIRRLAFGTNPCYRSAQINGI